MSPDEPKGEDLDLELLHLSGKERLDAILESPHLTDRQASEALDAISDAADASMPQVLIWKVYVPAYGRHPETWAPSYIGPFINRHAAEEWAAANLPVGDDVTTETAAMETPRMWVERVERGKRWRKELEQERENRKRLRGGE